MLGTKTITASALMAFSALAAPAQTPEYFPLQVGNSWVYRASAGRVNQVQTISVEAVEPLNGIDYYRVQFFGRTEHVRAGGNGSLVAYDAETKQERLWLPFGAPEGQKTNSEFDQCAKAATVRSRSANVKGPLGEFNNVLQLAYEPSCADAGIGSQSFLPYVGLLQQESTSIAGPVKYELVYSRTGHTAVDAGQIGFTMALDSQTYKAGENTEMMVRLTLRNTTGTPIALTFPSSQSYELKLYNEKGEIGYTWSADKLFAQVIRNEQITGERTWAFTAPVGQLAPGRYAAEAYLTTQPKAYAAFVHFEVVR